MALIEKPTPDVSVPPAATLDQTTFDFLDAYTAQPPAPNPAHAAVMAEAMESFKRIHRLT